MRFVCQELEKDLEWKEKICGNELIVESPLLLRKILRSFAENGEDKFVNFIEGGKELSIEKDVDVIYNPLKLDFNNRKAITTLFKILVKRSLSEDFYLETNGFRANILKYLDSIVDAENFIFEVTADDDFNIDSIAKAVNMRIVDDEDDFVELLTDYMTMMSELAGIKMFVFLNLRSLITIDELRRLDDNLKNRQINILLIENKCLEKYKNFGRIIVDGDLCEL